MSDRFIFYCVLSVVVILLLPVACQYRGKAVYSEVDKDGNTRKVEVFQPTDAREPATVVIDDKGGLKLTTSGTHQPASYTEKATTNWLMGIGAFFGVLAVVLFAGQKYMPLMPSNAWMGCGIASGVCFFLPTIIHEYTLYVLIGAGLWLAWTYYSYRHNKKLRNHVPFQDTTPKVP